MKTKLLWLLPFCFSFPACQALNEDPLQPIPEDWGPATYQVDAVYENGATQFYVRADDMGMLHHSFTPTPAADLPFRFYDHAFLNYPEILISSPYPIRANWFRAAKSDCLDPGDTPAGIEFSIVAARERDYLLIARLDSTYWECLREGSPSSEAAGRRLNFSFQILQLTPQTPTPFALQGLYSIEENLLHLKAKKDASGIWRRTANYQLADSQDLSFEIRKHPQLKQEYSLLRISSKMLLTPHSFRMGLAASCLDLADWEVHANRNSNRFLLDIVIPDCYLDCLHDVANGFEFEMEFFQ